VAGGEYFDGHRLIVIPEIEFRPSRHLLLKARYALTRVWLPFQMVGGVPTGGTATTHVLRTEVGIFFNPNVSWITIVQYDNVTNSMGINSRFRWIVEDGREIFVVLNQAFDTTDGIRRGRTEPLIKVVWDLRF
jgi:hypothetical protein